MSVIETGAILLILVLSLALGLGLLCVNQPQVYAQDITIQGIIEDIKNLANQDPAVTVAGQAFSDGQTAAENDHPTYNMTCPAVGDDNYCRGYMLGYIGGMTFDVTGAGAMNK